MSNNLHEMSFRRGILGFIGALRIYPARRTKRKNGAMVRRGHIDVVSRSDESSRLQVRTPTQGAELNLVLAFVEMLQDRCRTSSDTVMFLEPRIDSGYPDLVQVTYSPAFMDHWTADRMLLEDDSLRILAFLSHARGASMKGIASSLGMNASSVSKSLEFLHACGMANCSSNCWRASKRSDFLGINGITAYEAKMSAPGSVLKQALMNTRFASSSCALIASSAPSRKTVDSFLRTGIGLFTGPDFNQSVRPKKSTLPNCYVTLKFNEWVARLLYKGVIG